MSVGRWAQVEGRCYETPSVGKDPLLFIAAGLGKGRGADSPEVEQDRSPNQGKLCRAAPAWFWNIPFIYSL